MIKVVYLQKTQDIFVAALNDNITTAYSTTFSRGPFNNLLDYWEDYVEQYKRIRYISVDAYDDTYTHTWQFFSSKYPTKN